MTGWGKRLIAIAASGSIVIPVGVDGIAMARAHMGNPAWLPHAKLHCAMSFHAAIALGAGALALLPRPAEDRLLMALAAFLGTAFWLGLILAGFWPGTSYNFAGDPSVYIAPPRILGFAFDPNVVAAVVLTIAGWLGFVLTGTPHGTRPA